MTSSYSRSYHLLLTHLVHLSTRHFHSPSLPLHSYLYYSSYLYLTTYPVSSTHSVSFHPPTFPVSTNLFPLFPLKNLTSTTSIPPSLSSPPSPLAPHLHRRTPNTPRSLACPSCRMACCRSFRRLHTRRTCLPPSSSPGRDRSPPSVAAKRKRVRGCRRVKEYEVGVGCLWFNGLFW